MAVGGTCDVWWAAPVAPEAAPSLLELLDAHERDRLARFRRSADRARYLAAHALIRLVLGQTLGHPPESLTFDRTCGCGAQHGKPVLPGGPAFSLTHGGELVGVVVRAASGPVGLDVEPVRPLADLHAMVRHICSPHELERDPPRTPDAFFTTWTRKEALLKATGDGIAAPMSAITLSARGVTWTGTGAPDGPVWVRDLRPAPGFRAAVAGLGAPPTTLREHAAGELIAASAR
jgi:4'-phosphopantetheinyl transferase